MSECVLSVDIGTTSLKAGFITADGKVVSFCSEPFSNSDIHFVSQEWILSLKKAVEKLKTQNSDVVVKAVSVSGNGPTLVSDNGFTLSWNEDFSAESLLENSGIQKEFLKSIFLPRILLFKNLFHNEYVKSQKIYSGPEYLIYKLTGNSVTILPEKRYITAYWDAESLKKLNIPLDKLPSFVKLGKNCGLLSSSYAGEFGLPEVPVFGVGPDFIAGLIGTGTVEKGRLCDRSGSSEGINFCVNREIYYQGCRTLPGIKENLWNISILIPDSSSLPEDERLLKVQNAVQTLKLLAEKHHIDFPSQMKVTGGQAKDAVYFEKKKQCLKKLGLDLVLEDCIDAELLGDAKIAWEKIENADL